MIKSFHVIITIHFGKKTPYNIVRSTHHFSKMGHCNDLKWTHGFIYSRKRAGVTGDGSKHSISAWFMQ